MELEVQIKQKKPFESISQKTFVNLVVTHNALKSNMHQFFSQNGITNKQYNILRILKGADKPVSLSYIRERLLEKLSDVSRIIDRMESKGFVTKKASKEDKRLIDIVLIEAGYDKLLEIDDTIGAVEQMFAALNQNEVKQLNKLLDKLRIANS